MVLPLSILFSLIALYAALTRSHRISVSICIASLMIDRFAFVIGGVNLLFIYVVAIFNIPYVLQSKIYREQYLKNIIEKFKIEFVYLIVLGIIFGFIFPWQDFTGTRSWNQIAQGRTIVQLSRMFLEFILFFYIINLLFKKKISLDFIVYAFAIFSLLSFWVGLIDYFVNYSIHDIIFLKQHLERGRFLGLNGEPKALGRQAAFAFALISLYIIERKKKSPILKYSLITNFWAIVLSSSASAFILFLILIYIVYFRFKIKNLVWGVVIFIAFISVFVNNPFTKDIQYLTIGKVDKAIFGQDNYWVINEPDFFKRFDIWDRLALIFLWKNPEYIFTGVGPNLISIPMSDYIPKSSVFFELGRVDSVPNVLFINILARSGIFGLLVYILGLYKIYSILLESTLPFSKKLFFISFVFSAIYFVFFLFYLSIVIGSFLIAKNESKDEIINYNT